MFYRTLFLYFLILYLDLPQAYQSVSALDDSIQYFLMFYQFPLLVMHLIIFLWEVNIFSFNFIQLKPILTYFLPANSSIETPNTSTNLASVSNVGFFAFPASILEIALYEISTNLASFS